jgi:hypothetical protein
MIPNLAGPLCDRVGHGKDLVPACVQEQVVVPEMTTQLSPRTFGTFSRELQSLACPDHFRAADAPFAPGDVERR